MVSQPLVPNYLKLEIPDPNPNRVFEWTGLILPFQISRFYEQTRPMSLVSTTLCTTLKYFSKVYTNIDIFICFVLSNYYVIIVITLLSFVYIFSPSKTKYQRYNHIHLFMELQTIYISNYIYKTTYLSTIVCISPYIFTTYIKNRYVCIYLYVYIT